MSGPAARAGLAPPNESARRLRFAYYYVYVGALMASPALLLLPATSIGLSSDNALTATWVALQGVAVLIMLTRRHARPQNLLIALALGGFVVASALWSAAPETTVRYGVILMGTLLVAQLMASDLTMHELLAMVMRVALVMSVIGLVLYFGNVSLAHYYDVHDRPNVFGGGPFRGLFPHKITAGLFAVMGVVAALATCKGARRVFTIAVFTLVVLLTSSSVALVLLPLAIAVFAITKAAIGRRVKIVWWITMLVALFVLGGWALTGNWEGFLEVLGRDTTLTGRTLLWTWGIETWAERPIFGWGFKAYFETNEALWRASTFDEFRTYDVPHFHQAYIQVAVDLGIIGLIVTVWILIRTLVRSYSRASELGPSTSAGMFTMTLMIAAAAVVINIIPTFNYPVTLFVAVAYFALVRNESPPKPDALLAPDQAVGGTGALTGYRARNIQRR